MTHSALFLLLLTPLVAAHGHVLDLIVDKNYYVGWDIYKGMGYSGNDPATVGWPNTVQNDGFIDHSMYSDPSIICNNGATASKGYAEVAAGGIVQLDWSEWQRSHKGPVVDYLARCPDSGCSDMAITELKFAKIQEIGLVDKSLETGKWGSDLLIDNGNSWQVQIPKSIAPGLYVLRTEIIALHITGQPQNYPQCLTIRVTGDGTDEPSGTKGTELYSAEDPNNNFDIYTSFSSYSVPGPTLYSKASILTKQSKDYPTSTVDPLTDYVAIAAYATEVPVTSDAPFIYTTSAAVAASSTSKPVTYLASSEWFASSAAPTSAFSSYTSDWTISVTAVTSSASSEGGASSATSSAVAVETSSEAGYDYKKNSDAVRPTGKYYCSSHPHKRHHARDIRV